jgi:hypothetical protein
MYVTVSWEDGADIIPRTNIYGTNDSLMWYANPVTFTTGGKEGNIIIKIEPWGSETGTYAVMYGMAPPLMTEGFQYIETFKGGETVFYNFYGNAETAYEISWEDSKDQEYDEDLPFDLDVKVSAWEGTVPTGSYFFRDIDDGYTLPQTVSPSSSGPILIRVESEKKAGFFGITYRSLP